MKAVLIWAGLCGLLLLAGLFLRCLPTSLKGAGIILAFLCVNLGLLVKVCRSSK